MANATWETLLNNPGAGNDWTGVNGTALANSTTETIISASSPDFTFNLHAPSPFQGQVFRFAFWGEYSTTGTPTLQLRLRYGGAAGTLLLDTGAVTCISGASHTSWVFEGLLSIQAAGTSGSVMPQGKTTGIAAAGTVAMVPATTPAAVTIDTTAQKALVLTGTWGTASASNTVTVHEGPIEGMC